MKANYHFFSKIGKTLQVTNSPWSIIQIRPWDSLHLFPASEARLLVTKAHKSLVVATPHAVPLQFACNISTGKRDSSPTDESPDHFQPLPVLVLWYPPTQHPEVDPQRDFVKFSSWTDEKAARCPVRLRQRASDLSQEREADMYMKHLFWTGLICQPAGHDAAQNWRNWRHNSQIY